MDVVCGCGRCFLSKFRWRCGRTSLRRIPGWRITEFTVGKALLTARNWAKLLSVPGVTGGIGG